MKKLPDGILLDADYIVSNAIDRDAIGCGIYFLMRGKEIVYVGMAANFIRRIGQHKAKSFDKWFWVPCRPDRLRAVEREYIARFCPRLNKDAYGLIANRKASSGRKQRKPTAGRPKPPPGCYWRGSMIWGRKKIDGREFRTSLRTANPQEAAHRWREWTHTLILTNPYKRGHSVVVDNVAKSLNLPG